MCIRDRANTKKQGSNFDLAIATGIIIALGDIKNKNITKFLEETIFIGEPVSYTHLFLKNQNDVFF